MTSLDRTLELFASREPEAGEVIEAQRKLDAEVTARARSRSVVMVPRRGWLALSASAVIGAILVSLSLTSTPALAFSDVQEHLRDFTTLRFVVDQTMNGEDLLKTTVVVTREGKLRTDVGDVSVIVNPAEHRMITLVHSARMAIQAPFEASPRPDQALDWLQQIRDFQGMAKPLPARRIGGRDVSGWELDIAGSHITLWATNEGFPVSMSIAGATPLRLDYRFDYDVRVDAATFSTEVPAGYSAGKAED